MVLFLMLKINKPFKKWVKEFDNTNDRRKEADIDLIFRGLNKSDPSIVMLIINLNLENII